jgi:cytochrome c-type biogenesis protein CcmH
MRTGLALLILLTPIPVSADSRLPQSPLAYTQLPDPAKEKAARALMETIRCLVCQGQSIADSDAETAGDMRAMIRQRIAAGERPQSVRKWLIERYGNFITYDPPLTGGTAALWLAPILFLLGGLLLLRGRIRKPM